MPASSPSTKSTRSKSAARRDDRFSQEEANRTAPHHTEAEQALIASCVHDGGMDSVGRCIEAKIRPHSFFKPAHQVIFSAILALYEKQEPVDEVLLTKKLADLGEMEAVGGVPYISEVINRVETHAHLQHYIRIVRDTSLLRTLIRTCQETIEDALTGQDEIEHFLNDVEQKIYTLRNFMAVLKKFHLILASHRINESKKNLKFARLK